MRVVWESWEMECCWDLSSWPSLLHPLCPSWPHFSGRLRKPEGSHSKNWSLWAQGILCGLIFKLLLLSWTFPCGHFELPTTFLGTFVPLYIFSCCFLFFLRKLLLLLIGPAPTWKWMVEVGAPCPRAFFSPCSQASVALFLFCYESPFQCRVTVILWGFSIRLHQVCVLAHTVWLDGPGKVPCLNFSTYIMGSHLHPAHGVEHDSTCKGISIVPGIEDMLNEW